MENTITSPTAEKTDDKKPIKKMMLILSKATIDLLFSKASCTFGFTLIFFESILFLRFVFNGIIYFFNRI